MENEGTHSEEPVVNHREPEHNLWSGGVIAFVEHDHQGLRVPGVRYR